jgi:Virulence factor BrkB
VIGLLIVDGIVNRPERRVAGPVVQALMTFVIGTVFFAWTMHFLPDGRVPWRLFVPPALLTAALWVALGLFSSLYFSSVIIDDSKTYGTIGVVFTFLTWFILIGSVVVLGAACGAVWQQRTTTSQWTDLAGGPSPRCSARRAGSPPGQTTNRGEEAPKRCVYVASNAASVNSSTSASSSYRAKRPTSDADLRRSPWSARAGTGPVRAGAGFRVPGTGPTAPASSLTDRSTHQTDS